MKLAFIDLTAVVLQVLFYLSIGTNGQLCPSGSFTYNTGHCFSVNPGQYNFSAATSACQTNQNGNLVTVKTSGELFTLNGYVRIIALQNTLYWIGYRYNGTNLESQVDGSIAPSVVTNNILNIDPAPANDVCLAVRQDGRFVRTLCTTVINGYVCQYRITRPAITAVEVNGTAININEPQTYPLGLALNLKCTFTSTTATSIVIWTLNSAPITTGINTTSDSSVLLLERFLNEGVYTCNVTNRNGQSASANIQVYASIDDVRFVPGPMSPSGYIASANTNTTVLVQWVPPALSYVSNPLLLQYTIYYSTDVDIDFINGPNVTGLTSNSDGLGSYVLSDLQVGTIYYITMRASNFAGLGEIQTSVTTVTTFGNAPTTPPSDLKLSRNQANSALLAEWVGVETTPPVGDVAFYEVQFRDVGARDATKLFIGSGFTQASIFNVENAQSYEVRVRSAVQVQRSPIVYDFSPFSEWVMASGIIRVIPTIPTIQPIEDIGVRITVGVVVPVVIVILVIALVGFAVLLYINTKTANTNNTEEIDGGTREKTITSATSPVIREEEHIEMSSQPTEGISPVDESKPLYTAPTTEATSDTKS